MGLCCVTFEKHVYWMHPPALVIAVVLWYRASWDPWQYKIFYISKYRSIHSRMFTRCRQVHLKVRSTKSSLSGVEIPNVSGNNWLLCGNLLLSATEGSLRPSSVLHGWLACLSYIHVNTVAYISTNITICVVEWLQIVKLTLLRSGFTIRLAGQCQHNSPLSTM